MAPATSRKHTRDLRCHFRHSQKQTSDADQQTVRARVDSVRNCVHCRQFLRYSRPFSRCDGVACWLHECGLAAPAIAEYQRNASTLRVMPGRRGERYVVPSSCCIRRKRPYRPIDVAAMADSSRETVDPSLCVLNSKARRQRGHMVAVTEVQPEFNRRPIMLTCRANCAVVT